MAQHRRSAGVTSRASRSNVLPSVATISSRQRQSTRNPNPKYAKNPKYVTSNAPPSFLDKLSEQRHCLFFSCLFAWGITLLIWIYTGMGSRSNPAPIHNSSSNAHQSPFQRKFDEDPPWKHPIQPWEILPRPPKGQCTWDGPLDGFLAGCANDGCKNVNDIEEAKTQCSKDELCTGIIKVSKEREIYQLRSGGRISDSPSGEVAWRKSCVVDEEKVKELEMAQREKDKQPDEQKKEENEEKEVNEIEKNKEIIKDAASKNQNIGSIADRLDRARKQNDVEEKEEEQQQQNNENLNNNNINNNNNARKVNGNDDSSDNDPWSRFLPESIRYDHDWSGHHVLDDVHGYRLPFGDEEEEDFNSLSVHEKLSKLQQDLLDPDTGCFLEGPITGFIANCAGDNCKNHEDLDHAIDECLVDTSCTGVVQIVSGQEIYQLRSDQTIRDSPRDEVAYVKLCGDKAVDRMKEIAAATPAPQCFLDGPIKGFLGNCAGTECQRYFYFNDAMVECENLGQSQCVGVTRLPSGSRESFELRAIAPVISSESGEYSYLLQCNNDDHAKQPPPDPMDDPIIDEFEKIGEIIQVDDHQTNEVISLQTIYIGIASYRDPWCYKSVHTAFARARYPERVFVGVVQQNAEDDPDCITPQIPCNDDPTQVLCKYVDHIRVKKFHAKDAAGPTFGRHHADTLYDGEYFAVQVDAHMSFIKDWDMEVIAQWESLNNEYAILSTYPSEVKTGLDEYGNPQTRTAPIICDTRLLHNGMFKHEAAGEIRWPETHSGVPMISPYLGAGIVFSRGHRIVRVPYDCCLPMIFDGEEFTMGVRAWTNGYDLYAPAKSFTYHPYNRKKRPPLFWENQDGGRVKRSQNRIKKILGMPLEKGQEDNYDDTMIERYGLGTQRDLETYLKVFGIDIAKKKIHRHCPDAFSGKLHDRLHAFLRPNKRGINYDYVYIPSDHESEGEIDDIKRDNGSGRSRRKKKYLDVKERRNPKKKIAQKEDHLDA